MIIRFVSGLAGLAVLAASAYATIIHTGADFAQTILICASVGGLVAGAIVAAHVGGWYRFGVIVFILAGELVGGWMTFERTIELREYRVAIRLQQQEAVKVARDRLSKAEGTLKAAQGAVVSQSSLNGCKANCRQLLQDAVNAASSEVNTARTALSALPAPALADVSASKTGLEAWKISLTVAIALVLSTNGMGALLIAVAAHPVRTASVQMVATPDRAGPVNPDSPGDGPGRTEKQKALSELLGMLADGRTIPSQDHLADHWNRPKQTVSDWLREWRRIGVIPSETRIGRCKATMPA